MSDVLLVVECLQGTGDMTQARKIVKELLAMGKTVTVATSSGIPYFKEMAGDQLKLVALPPLTYNLHRGEYEVARDASAPRHPLFNTNGGYTREAEAALQTRTDAILHELQETTGPVFCGSGWPFWLGEGILDREMNALLHAAQHLQKPVNLVTRDVLNADSPPMANASTAIGALFQSNPKLRWLVLGDENILSIPDAFLTAHAIPKDRVTYVGFGEKSLPVQPTLCPPSDIVVSPGGGDFRYSSLNILRAAIAAAPHMPEKRWTLISGNNYPEEAQALLEKEAETARAQGATITLTRQMPPDAFQDFLREKNPIFIGQGGIGLTNDIIKNKLKALLIPISTPIQYRALDGSQQSLLFDEQLVRTTALESAGLIATLNPADTGTEINQPLEHIPQPFIEALIAQTQKAGSLRPDFSRLKTDGFKKAARYATPEIAATIADNPTSRIPG